MIKIKKTVLTKLDKEVKECNGAINGFKEEVIIKPNAELDQLQVELNDKMNMLSDMKINGIGDSTKFLTLKQEISELERDIKHHKEIVATSDEIFKEFITNKHDALYKNYCENQLVKTEYGENMLLFQKSLFKKFSEIEDILMDMDQVSTEYDAVVKCIKHPKIEYVNCNATVFKNRVHLRFGLNKLVKYSTMVSDEKESFEF